MSLPRYTFTKGERLRKKKYIEALFRSKYQFLCYPYRVVYCFLEMQIASAPAQVLISIPKRKIKKAVKRNLLKRRTREAYRVEKQSLYTHLDEQEKNLAIGLIYVADEVLNYNEIDNAIKTIVKTLKEKI